MSKLIEVVFDTETTGFDYKNGDRVVEIGALRIYDKMTSSSLDDTFHFLINPERDIPEEVVKVHGITNDKVKDAPVFSDIVDDFLAFIGDAPLVAHNASFDVNFINTELKLLGRNELTNKVIDTLPIARKKFPGARVTLDSLCNKFGVDLSARTFHGALLDSQLLADVYLHLSGGLQHGFSLDEVKKVNKKDIDLKSLIGDRKPIRKFDINEEYLSIHNKFLSDIGAKFW